MSEQGLFVCVQRVTKAGRIPVTMEDTTPLVTMPPETWQTYITWFFRLTDVRKVPDRHLWLATSAMGYPAQIHRLDVPVGEPEPTRMQIAAMTEWEEGLDAEVSQETGDHRGAADHESGGNPFDL